MAQASSIVLRDRFLKDCRRTSKNHPSPRSLLTPGWWTVAKGNKSTLSALRAGIVFANAPALRDRGAKTSNNHNNFPHQASDDAVAGYSIVVLPRPLNAIVCAYLGTATVCG